MRLVLMIAALGLAAGAVRAQDSGSLDPLSKACMIAAGVVVDGPASEIESQRVHRRVDIEWSVAGARYEHTCYFLDGDSAVPELVRTETRRGSGDEVDVRLRDQNDRVWFCMVEMPDHEACDPTK
ncbi:hypothetical protein [Devosia sp. SL43]|uniref:hypothetical protein n=1 Tax=Devosia sp. SL43 TaxID=2806348 RepID=UPI001F2E90A2|nr:hypothetical protein [Devosia sp. SL43]UJW87954.1 hypothetical protein IM737_20585 [Devosia sp. SL43]